LKNGWISPGQYSPTTPRSPIRRRANPYGSGCDGRSEPTPRRPQKLAKGVNIYFTREFCKAYEGLEAARQTDWDTKVRELLASKYGTFNPDHNAPHGVPMPAESWFVTPGAVRPA
jgi:hypothetical protein